MAEKKNEAGEIARLFRKLEENVLYDFPARRKPLCAPENHGVYVIEDKNGQVLHVGRTLTGKGGLHQRLKNHLGGSSSFMRNYRKINKDKLREQCRFRYIKEKSPRTRALLEAYAIGRLCPAYIGTGEKRS